MHHVRGVAAQPPPRWSQLCLQVVAKLGRGKMLSIVVSSQAAAMESSVSEAQGYKFGWSIRGRAEGVQCAHGSRWKGQVEQ